MFALTNRSFTKELRRSLRDCRPRASLKLCLFEDGYSLCIFGYFIPLLFLDRLVYQPDEIMHSWGFTLMDRSIGLWWGRKSKFISFPWDWKFIKHEVRRPDGSWVPYIAEYENKGSDGRWTETYPYRYVLQRGEIQERTATVFVERREWRWLWAKWLSWPSLKRQCIAVEFNDEVGERTGSWKGGCVGCGYDMKPGETPLDTLRRMERERVFD